MQRQEVMFDAAVDPGQVYAALSARYGVLAERSVAGRLTFLDTADWRLHSARMSLRDARSGRTAELLLDTPEAALRAPVPRRAWPARLQALPDSPVRERIASAVGIRALLPLAEVDVRSTALSVLDQEQKTRVRVLVDQQRLISDSRAVLPLRVVISPVRGYDRDADRCAAMLGDALPTLGTTSATSVALEAAGRVPGAVASASLDPHRPAVESLTVVLRHYLDVIDATYPGVVADLDVEFLHDMRTAVRAARSILRMGGYLLPGDDAALLRSALSWLGNLTGQLRDLDVSLLRLEGRSDLDVEGIDGLEPLLAHLGRRRRAAVRTLRQALRSDRGRHLTTECRRALDSVPVKSTTGVLTRQAALEQVLTAHSEVTKAGKGITPATPADDLHRLRRRCKTMRYSLEGYSSVFAAEPYRDVVGVLKRVQDALGGINDADVQSRELTRLAVAMSRRRASTETILAIGALRDRVRQQDAIARSKLESDLTQLRSAALRERVVAFGKPAS